MATNYCPSSISSESLRPKASTARLGSLLCSCWGLYIFWLLILYGGQITYAIQNANQLTNESAWQGTSQRTREAISLALMVLVARQLQNGKPALSTTELQQKLRIPSHILNSVSTTSARSVTSILFTKTPKIIPMNTAINPGNP